MNIHHLLNDKRNERAYNTGEKSKIEEEKKEEPQETLIKVIQNLTQTPDLIEIFGETRTGKSTLSLCFFKSAEASGLKSLYIDTEQNIPYLSRPASYKLCLSLEKLQDVVYHLEDGYGFLVLDSIGMPVLGSFAKASLRERGNMLLAMQAMLYHLKDYADRNQCWVLLTNQPVSELAVMDIEDKWERKRALEERPPFGDKCSYFVKEILKSELLYSNPSESLIRLTAWGSRTYGRGTEILKMKIKFSKVIIVKKELCWEFSI